MRLSSKAEYACIAVLELACSYAKPKPVQVGTIAKAHHIPQRFLVQILLQLKTAGLVASLRGKEGGYQLARPPEEISLADVIQAVDKEALRPLRNVTSSAGSPAVQAIHAAWKEVQAEEQRLLEELTFAELVRRTQPTGDLSYQI
jgi:Rrf2 family protein